ncbi:hypothetical protein BCR42DRAFT_398841 [Absidia repens]|uniref:Uncharacterized protein n=1 Tax=Absidia repens TaxID=90262 RepID=A0A1X2HRE8_9FUNG|nr:hypothetical protein BCR42DRAFT_398841 [Absidia repens]
MAAHEVSRWVVPACLILSTHLTDQGLHYGWPFFCKDTIDDNTLDAAISFQVHARWDICDGLKFAHLTFPRSLDELIWMCQHEELHFPFWKITEAFWRLWRPSDDPDRITARGRPTDPSVYYFMDPSKDHPAVIVAYDLNSNVRIYLFLKGYRVQSGAVDSEFSNMHTPGHGLLVLYILYIVPGMQHSLILDDHLLTLSLYFPSGTHLLESQD